MKNKMKFKIGEFSKLCQVTVKTLRHYEEIGLMIPVEVDRVQPRRDIRVVCRWQGISGC